MTAPLCFLDTETTGVHPDRQVWEVAMIRREGTDQREMQLFVSVDLSGADPFGLSVGRFYERHPFGQFLAGIGIGGAASGPLKDDPDIGVYSPAETAKLVARMTHGAHIVGAVPNFDTEVLGKMLRDNGIIPGWHYHLVDVEALAVGFLHSQAVEFPGGKAADFIKPGLPWKSDALTAALGLDPVPDDERHTALGDARWAMRTYDAIVGAS